MAILIRGAGGPDKSRGLTATAGDIAWGKTALVDGKVVTGTMGTRLGDVAVGDIVKLLEGGAPVEYLVVHQGLPSDLYDVSCDGTWLLRKDIYENRQWHSSQVNDYANSTIHSYLNSTFLDRFDAAIQSAIKQVKIPYTFGTKDNSTVKDGADGLSCKIFLLSVYEMGLASSDNKYLLPEGAKLAYFDAGSGTSEKNKRIAYLDGKASIWLLRSPYASHVSSINVWMISGDGGLVFSGTNYNKGVRPALVLSSTVGVLPDGTVVA